MSRGERPAVLFLTHRWDKVVRLRFERLVDEAGPLADVFLYMQKSEAADRAEAEGGGIARALVRFDAQALPGSLGYPYGFDNALTPGSGHFAVLAFARKVRRGHYFLIEYDVDFSGRWSDFIAGTLASTPDLATLHIRSMHECPDWNWWRACRPSERDRGWARDPRNMLRSFNPVYCLSLRAAQIVHAAHREGWRAHHELLFPTVLSHRGCKLVDLGPALGFCLGIEQDRLPGKPAEALSTVRWRPKVTPNEFLARSTGKTLFHPVKDDWYFDGEKLVSVQSDPSAA